MRIMHLVNHCGKANGHVNVSVDLACTQANNGHVVGYTCDRGDYMPLLESFGVKVYHVTEPHRHILKFIVAQWDFLRAVRHFKPDVIHVHMVAQNVLVQPYRLFGYKTVTTVHNEFDRSVWLMGLASRIVAVSKAGALAMMKRGFSKNKVRIVLNGTIGSPRLAEEFALAELLHPAILTVCGLHDRKGVRDLLHAFETIRQQFPEAQLYLLGEGPKREEYQALSQTLGISQATHFIGYRDDPREYLFAADIFVLASHADPGPLVIAEARNAGCAIVATDVDGIPEMLDHGQAGILVPSKRPDLLAAAILELLKDAEMLQKYASLAKQNVERLTVKRVCREMDEIYAELL